MLERLYSILNHRNEHDVELELATEQANEWAAAYPRVDRASLLEAAKYARETDVAESDSDDDELAATRGDRVEPAPSSPDNVGDEDELDAVQ